MSDLGFWIWPALIVLSPSAAWLIYQAAGHLIDRVLSGPVPSAAAQERAAVVDLNAWRENRAQAVVRDRPKASA